MSKHKKLTFGTNKLVVIEEAVCNYCGEAKDCFKTVKPATFDFFGAKFENLECQFVAVDPELKYTLFGKYYKAKETEIKWMVKENGGDRNENIKTHFEEVSAHICKDCAKEITNYKG